MCAISMSVACPINRQMSPRNVFVLLPRRSVRSVGRRPRRPAVAVRRTALRPNVMYCVRFARWLLYCRPPATRATGEWASTSGLRLDNVYMHQHRHRLMHNFPRNRVFVFVYSCKLAIRFSVKPRCEISENSRWSYKKFD